MLIYCSFLCFGTFLLLAEIIQLFCVVLAENIDNVQVRPLFVVTDHDAAQPTVPPLDTWQLNTAAEDSVVNSVSAENATSHVAVNGSHVISTRAQSLSHSPNVIKPPVCVVQSVYTLPVQ